MSAGTIRTTTAEGASPARVETIKTALGSRLLVRPWAIWTVVGLVLFHAALFGLWRMRATSAGFTSPQIMLGDFEFTPLPPRASSISRARFRLHVTLLTGSEGSGRALLTLRQHKVQQSIEQLLRQAHSRDFEDPLLVDLKRQIQAGVNDALGLAAVGEVIITAVVLESNERISPLPNSPEPWKEPISPAEGLHQTAGY